LETLAIDKERNYSEGGSGGGITNGGIINLFSTFFNEFLSLLTGGVGNSGPNLAGMQQPILSNYYRNNPNGNDDGAGFLLHFGNREYVLFSFWKVGSTLGGV
jgi:hypothetical protein